MKSKVFEKELNKIEDEIVRSDTTTLLNMLPDYFYEIPASTSGKYHPLFSLGIGGLVRHTKVASRILEEMFRDKAFGEYTSHEKDLMRMSILLHDGLKCGYNNIHTVRDHPILMADFIEKNSNILKMNKEDIDFIKKVISSHMGPWNTDKEGNEILPFPSTNEELLIHLCDYIASRNFLNVTFEDNEIVDSVKRMELIR